MNAVNFECSAVNLHEHGPLCKILGPPKEQVSNIFKNSRVASFPEDLIIVKIFKIDVFISAERGKQGGFDGIIFN